MLHIIQLISYKRYFESTLVQWRLSIYPKCTQVVTDTFFMRYPVYKLVGQYYLSCLEKIGTHKLLYRGCREKRSGDIGSVVCYTMYTMYTMYISIPLGTFKKI